MGPVAHAYDNATTESLFASLKRELLKCRRFRSHAEARMAVIAWIEVWCNPHRRHSSLRNRSPLNCARAHERSVT
jgi:putative transposase